MVADRNELLRGHRIGIHDGDLGSTPNADVHEMPFFVNCAGIQRMCERQHPRNFTAGGINLIERIISFRRHVKKGSLAVYYYIGRRNILLGKLFAKFDGPEIGSGIVLKRIFMDSVVVSG